VVYIIVVVMMCFFADERDAVQVGCDREDVSCSLRRAGR